MPNPVSVANLPVPVFDPRIINPLLEGIVGIKTDADKETISSRTQTLFSNLIARRREVVSILGTLDLYRKKLSDAQAKCPHEITSRVELDDDVTVHMCRVCDKRIDPIAPEPATP